MSFEKIKKSIIENSFILNIRTEAVYNESEYFDLIDKLEKVKIYMKSRNSIDKELMLSLYMLPQELKNLSEEWSRFKTLPDGNGTDLIESAWIEVDRLVLEILS